MTKKELIKYFDLIAYKYAEDKFKQELDPERVDMFLKYLEKGSKILDFGCGPGRDSQYFLKQGYTPIGIDFSSKMIEQAKNRVKGVEFVNDDLLKRRIKAAYFDGFWASSVFGRISLGSYLFYFKRINKILKKGGVIYIDVKKGPEKTEVISEELFGENVKLIDTQVSFENLLQTLQQAEFKVLEHGVYNLNNKNFIWIIAEKECDIEKIF